MEPGTFTFRMNVLVKPSKAEAKMVNIPIDAVIQPKKAKLPHLPILIEAKSAGDFTNVNKRRKEEATKINQLKATYGKRWYSCCFSADILTRHIWATKPPKA